MAVQELGTTTLRGQVLMRPSNGAAAVEALKRITESLRGRGSEVTEQQVAGTSVTTLAVPQVGRVAWAAQDGFTSRSFAYQPVKGSQYWVPTATEAQYRSQMLSMDRDFVGLDNPTAGTVRVGGFDVDAAIQAYVRREYGMAIGERTGEEIKLAIGSAFSSGDQYKAEVRGRDLTTGTAKIIVLSPEEVREAIDEPVRAILEIIVRALGQTPPELAQDLIHQGVHLVGGGGMLRGMDQRISKETALPVHLVDAPLECVVHGAGRCLESFDRLKDMFMDRPRS